MSHEHLGPDPHRELTMVLVYLTELRTYMRMDHWDIFVMDEPPEDEDAHADIITNDNHWSAQLRLQSDWYMLNGAQKVNTLVHELIHLSQRGLVDLWWMSVMRNSMVAASDSSTWNAMWELEMERMTSALTRVVAEGAPPWPAKGSNIGSGIYLQERA